MPEDIAPRRTRASAAEPSGGSSVGLREKNKLDKLRRIENAARALFLSKGYDETTTREIAARAGVGMGTVFTYADSKRDLLFLIANEDLETTTRKAEADISPGASLIANLLSAFGDHYEYFSRQPELSRLMLREMVFYDSGQQAKRFQATRERIIALTSEIVRLALARKEISSPEDPRLIGWVIFCIYQVELRRWLADGEPDVKAGLASLARALRLFMVGLSPQPEALSGAPPKTAPRRR